MMREGFALLLLFLALVPVSAADPPRWWDAAEVRIWYAQHGYEPDHPKRVTTCLTAERFRIERAEDGQEVFSGELRPIEPGWRQGDFTAFRTPGTYRIRIGDETGPGTFTIAPHRWDDLLQASAWHYFGLRRMGENNLVGNLGDERLVNWEHARFVDADGTNRFKYLGRAWGDGDDGRTYASCSLVVAQYCALQDTNPTWDRGDWIYQQVRWGLDGALSFLEKDGTLHWILSSLDHHQISYDNRFYSGDEKRLVAWNDVQAATEEYNDANPEVIGASLLIGPAYAAALFRERDPAFFARVEALVRLGHRRITERYGTFPTKYSLGAWIWLNVAMHRMTGEARFLDLAADGADRLLTLQQRAFAGDGTVRARGWFRRDLTTTANPQGEKPEQEVMITPWIYQGLFQLIAAHPGHPHAAAWRSAVGSYARDYLLTLSRLDPFGFTPMKVTILEPEQKNPLRQRRGNLAWSNFAGRMGRQFHQIGNAAYLVQAGRLLDDQELIGAGWQQLFWFSGHNPKGLASIHGFGTNVCSGQYFRDTLGRCFPGGTVNGAIGNTQDQPWFWAFNEYYTYANLNVLWFATVACGDHFSDALALWPREIQEAPHTADPEHHPRASFPVRLKGGAVQRFAGLVPGTPDQPITWSVDGIPGGNAAVGTIAADGTYTAPRVVAPRQIRIEAVASQEPLRRATTSVTLMPVPGAVPALRLTTTGTQVDLAWDRAEGLVSGYTIWKRLPVGPDAVGTIFEMVGAVGPDETRSTYPHARIHHYQDDLLPIGTEFLVRAYAERRDPNFHFPPNQGWHPGWELVLDTNPNAIYGFGDPSPVVTLVPGVTSAAEPAATAFGDPDREPQPSGWPLTDPAEWAYVNQRFKGRSDRALPGRYQADNMDATGAILPGSWMKQHATLVERLDGLTSSPDIVLIGDSITQNWGNTALMGKSLAATRPVPAWTTYFPNYLFFNLGQAGGSQAAALWRLRHGGLKGSHDKAVMDPKIAIVNLGVNPLIVSDNYPEMAVGTRLVAEEVRRQFPRCRVLVLAVFPTARKAERVAPLNAAVAKELKPLTDDPASLITYLDIGAHFLEADGTTLKEQYFHDRLHPNDLGYEVISAAIKPTVDALMLQAYGGRPFPVITAPIEVDGPRNTPLRIPITVSDSAGPAGGLRVSAVSDLPDLVADDGLVVSGQDGTRILTITPKPDQGGVVRIRIDAANALGQTARQEVLVAVGDPLPPLVIYGDRYENGWDAKGGPDRDSTTQVRTGTRSLKVTQSDFRIDAAKGKGAAITNYRSVTFWLHGGAIGGQKLQLYLCQAGGPFAVMPVPPAERGTYRQVTIPLDAFRHAGGTELNGLMFKGGGTVDLYIDDMTLDPCHPSRATP